MAGCGQWKTLSYGVLRPVVCFHPAMEFALVLAIARTETDSLGMILGMIQMAIGLTLAKQKAF